MSVDREGSGRHSSVHPRAREVGKYQLSLHLHRLHGLGRCEKAAVGGKAEMRTFLPFLPPESYHSGQLASS